MFGTAGKSYKYKLGTELDDKKKHTFENGKTNKFLFQDKFIGKLCDRNGFGRGRHCSIMESRECHVRVVSSFRTFP